MNSSADLEHKIANETFTLSLDKIGLNNRHIRVKKHHKQKQPQKHSKTIQMFKHNNIFCNMQQKLIKGCLSG